MRLSNKILLATRNREKFEEFQTLFSAFPDVELAMADSIVRNTQGLEFAERHETYLENAIAKARLINLASHYPTLGDDSGLEVAGLGGRPGVRSHRYATPKAGIPQDIANNELLLRELAAKPGTRDAKFVCTLVVVIEGILLHANGILEGTIGESPRGTNGFGYDSLFIPKGQGKTFAEMTSDEKNAISHRAKALNQIMSQVRSHGIIFAKP